MITNNATLRVSASIALSALGLALACSAPIRYSSPGMKNDYGNGVAVNPATGDVYVASSTYNNAIRQNDMFLIKYNAAGVVQWGRFFGTNGNDAATEVIFANNGIYVTGYVQPGADKNTALLHYDQAGVLLQFRVSALPGDDVGHVLQRDAGGGIYVGGTSTNPGTGLDFQINKFTGGLVPIWGRTWGIAGPDQLVAMVYHPVSGLFAAGSRTTGGGTTDGAVIRLNPATGGLVNARLFPGFAGKDDVCTDITTDVAGIPFMTMTQSLPGALDTQVTTHRLTPALATTWAYAFNAVAGMPDQSAKVRVGPTTVVVAGSSFGVSGANFDYAVHGINPVTGALLAGWPTFYNNGGNDRITDLALNPGVAIFVTGISVGAGGTDDYATVNVNPGGIGWATRYHNFAGDQPAKMAFGPAFSSVYVTGTSADAVTGLDIATGKYHPITGANVW